MKKKTLQTITTPSSYSSQMWIMYKAGCRSTVQGRRSPGISEQRQKFYKTEVIKKPAWWISTKKNLERAKPPGPGYIIEITQGKHVDARVNDG
ncbi:hypothetical protein Y032_0243g3498 [Ancylostoma ceylanicum]|uniref:Uncharacterized protein n=1 Tax=Ancylostoma ceylanicum TaxID=53326 RepID=A0A016SDC7_9BILA|nr:hypothetical protein Y032_0243g3498 [Ancylostoma ceylanicum]